MSRLVGANEKWLRMLDEVMLEGHTSSPRGMKIKEVLGYQSIIDMKSPVVSMPESVLSRKFLTGEALWIINGDNRVSTIAPYNKHIANFSDDGVFFNGAYGPMVVEQLSYVVDSLVKDRDSRQAVLTIWRPNPRPSKDFPCTVAIQFMIRHGALHCFDTMRSSDCWLGWPYDVFNFSMLSAYVALLLRERGVVVDLGSLTLTAGSQHIYEKNFDGVEKCLAASAKSLGRSMTPLELSDFASADEFLVHLQMVRDFTRTEGEPYLDLNHDFLRELVL